MKNSNKVLLLQKIFVFEVNIVSPSPNKPNKQQSHHSWSDGSLCLGLETTFAGHKGCHPFSEFPFDTAKISIFLLSSKLFPEYLQIFCFDGFWDVFSGVILCHY